MFHKARLATLIAEKALQFGEFTLASGQKSSFYLDLSTITLDPEGLSLVCQCFWDVIEDYRQFGFDAIAGPMSGADPIIGAMVFQSHLVGKNYKGLMIRSQTKSHGDTKLIEGPVKRGMQVVVVEDVVTTGGSVKKAIQALKEAGCNPFMLLSVVDRGDRSIGHDIRYHPLFKLEDLALSKKVLDAVPGHVIHGAFPCNTPS